MPEQRRAQSPRFRPARLERLAQVRIAGGNAGRIEFDRQQRFERRATKRQWHVLRSRHEQQSAAITDELAHMLEHTGRERSGIKVAQQ